MQAPQKISSDDVVDPHIGCQLGPSLPPRVKGRVSGEVELRVCKAVCVAPDNSHVAPSPGPLPSSSTTSNAKSLMSLLEGGILAVRCGWWGDPSAGSLFTPRVFRSEEDEGLLPVTPGNRIVFPMHSRWDKMQAYFVDAGSEGVVFDIIDPNTHLITGRACFDTSALALSDGALDLGKGAMKAPFTLSRVIPIYPYEVSEEGSDPLEGEAGVKTSDTKCAVGYLHLKVMVRLGSLSVVRRVLEDKLVPKNGGLSPVRSRQTRQMLNRIGPDAPSPSSETRQPARSSTLGQGRQKKQQQLVEQRDVTGLMLPSMLSSFQLNEVLAENDSSSILERFPPSTTKHFQPAGHTNSLPSFQDTRRKRAQLNTSWSDPRPLFAAAALFASAADAVEAENLDEDHLKSHSIGQHSKESNSSQIMVGGALSPFDLPVSTTNGEEASRVGSQRPPRSANSAPSEILPVPPPPPSPPMEGQTFLGSDANRAQEGDMGSDETAMHSGPVVFAVDKELKMANENAAYSVKQPKIGPNADEALLDDVMERASRLREAMSAAVQAYEPSVDEIRRFSAANEGLSLTNQYNNLDVDSPGNVEVEHLIAAGISQQASVAHRRKNQQFLAMEDGATVDSDDTPAVAEEDDPMQFSQGFAFSIASGVPLDALIYASPEYSDKPISDKTLDSLLRLTANSEKEALIARQPFPSISMLGLQLDTNLKRVCAIRVSIQRLIIMQTHSKAGPPSATSRTARRPFRPAERNWEVQFDRRDFVTKTREAMDDSLEGDQPDSAESAPVFSCLSLATNRNLEEDRAFPASFKSRSGKRAKRKLVTTIDFEHDGSGIASDIPIKFDNELVGWWIGNAGTGQVSFDIRCSRIQRSPLSKIPGLAPTEEELQTASATKSWGKCSLSLKSILADPKMCVNMALPISRLKTKSHDLNDPSVYGGPTSFGSGSGVTDGDTHRSSAVREETCGFLDVSVSAVFDPSTPPLSTAEAEHAVELDMKARRPAQQLKKEHTTAFPKRPSEHNLAEISEAATVNLPEFEDDIEIDDEVDEEDDDVVQTSSVTETKAIISVDSFAFIEIDSDVSNDLSNKKASHLRRVRVVHRPWQLSHRSLRGNAIMWVEQETGTQNEAGGVVHFDHKASFVAKLAGDGSHASSSSYIFELWEDCESEGNSGRGDGVLLGIARIPLTDMGVSGSLNTVVFPEADVCNILTSEPIGLISGKISFEEIEQVSDYEDEEKGNEEDSEVDSNHLDVDDTCQPDITDSLVSIRGLPMRRTARTPPRQLPKSEPIFSPGNPLSNVDHVRHEFRISLLGNPPRISSGSPFIRYSFPIIRGAYSSHTQASTRSSELPVQDGRALAPTTTLWWKLGLDGASQLDADSLGSTASHIIRLRAPSQKGIEDFLNDHMEAPRTNTLICFEVWGMNSGQSSSQDINMSQQEAVANLDISTLLALIANSSDGRETNTEVSLPLSSGESTLNLRIAYQCSSREGHVDETIDQSTSDKAIPFVSTTTKTQRSITANSRLVVQILETELFSDSPMPDMYIVRGTLSGAGSAWDSQEEFNGDDLKVSIATNATALNSEDHCIQFMSEKILPITLSPDSVSALSHGAAMFELVRLGANGEKNDESVIGSVEISLTSIFTGNGMIGGWFTIWNNVGKAQGRMHLSIIISAARTVVEEPRELHSSPDIFPSQVSTDDDMTTEEERGVEELAKTIVTILSAGNPPASLDDDSRNERESAIAEVEELNAFMDHSIMSDDSLEDSCHDSDDSSDLNGASILGEDGKIQYSKTSAVTLGGINSKLPEYVPRTMNKVHELAWGCVEVSVCAAMHLRFAARTSEDAFDSSSDSEKPQFYVTYRWNHTSPIVSTPLTVPSSSSRRIDGTIGNDFVATSLSWNHKRVISVPMPDLSLSCLKEKVLFLSVWQRPQWGERMFGGKDLDANDPKNMPLCRGSAVSGSTLPGDRLVGICRVPLIHLSPSMPLIDGWYNVLSPDQSLAGQLRLRIAPDIQNTGNQEENHLEINEQDQNATKNVVEVKEDNFVENEYKYSPPPAVSSPNPLSPPKLSSQKYRSQSSPKPLSPPKLSSQKPDKFLLGENIEHRQNTKFTLNISASKTIPALEMKIGGGILKDVMSSLDEVQEALRARISNSKRSSKTSQASKLETKSTLGEQRLLSSLTEKDYKSQVDYGDFTLMVDHRGRSLTMASDAYSNDFEVRSSRAASHAYSDDFETRSSEALSEYSEDFENVQFEPPSRRDSRAETEYTDDFENYGDEHRLLGEEDEEPRSVVMSIEEEHSNSGSVKTPAVLPDVTDPYILHMIEVARKRSQNLASTAPIQRVDISSDMVLSSNVGSLNGNELEHNITVWQNGESTEVPISQLRRMNAMVDSTSVDVEASEPTLDGSQKVENDVGQSGVDGELSADDGNSNYLGDDAKKSERGRLSRRSSSSLLDSMRDTLPNLWDGYGDESFSASPAKSSQDSAQKRKQTSAELDRIARIMRGSNAGESSSDEYTDLESDGDLVEL